MRRLCLVMISVSLVILGAAALSFWLLAQRGYPNLVYYERVAVSGSIIGNSPQITEIWVDPRTGRELRLNHDPAGSYTSLIAAGDQHEYTIRDGATYEDAPIPDDAARSLRADWQQLAHGGFRALGAYRFAHALGPVHRVRLGDHPALRFETDRHDHQTQHLLVWLDARTRSPLQLEVQGFDYTLVQRVLSTRRIAPGRLPAAFFDLPHPHTSYWDQAVQWIRGRLGIHR